MKKRPVSHMTSIMLSAITWYNRGGISTEFHQRLVSYGGKKAIKQNYILNRQLYSDMRTGAILN